MVNAEVSFDVEGEEAEVLGSLEVNLRAAGVDGGFLSDIFHFEGVDEEVSADLFTVGVDGADDDPAVGSSLAPLEEEEFVLEGVVSVVKSDSEGGGIALKVDEVVEVGVLEDLGSSVEEGGFVNFLAGEVVVAEDGAFVGDGCIGAGDDAVAVGFLCVVGEVSDALGEFERVIDFVGPDGDASEIDVSSSVVGSGALDIEGDRGSERLRGGDGGHAEGED